MKQIGFALIFTALASLTMPRVAQNSSLTASVAARPVIQIGDVNRFYKVYDAAGGNPTADQLQHEYIDPGSDGLHHFAQARNVTGARIVDALAKNPHLYFDARRCAAVLPEVRQRLQLALERLGRLYAEARFPPVTIVIGRGRPVAISGPSTGVQVGLEALCATNWLNPNVEDRFVHVIAHEYVHVQQSKSLENDEHPTVLEVSVVEGAAEFVGELISGEVAYSQHAEQTKGHEKEIETAFASDENSTDLSKWLYNSTPEQSNDLGYWVGYRIVKSYYQHAADKRQALREILQTNDPKALLAKSGWHPGIQLR